MAGRTLSIGLVSKDGVEEGIVSYELDLFFIREVPYSGRVGNVTFFFDGKASCTFSDEEFVDIPISVKGKVVDRPVSRCSLVDPSGPFAMEFTVELTIPVIDPDNPDREPTTEKVTIKFDDYLR